MGRLENVTTGLDNHPPARSTTARILVTDDEASVRQFLSVIIEAEGYVVVTAESGKEAVERLRLQHFDVALTDLMMPGMDGVRTMAALKDLDPDLEVIVLTGCAAVDSATDSLKQGACDYLQKPIEAKQLRSALSRALEIRRLNTTRSCSEAALTLVESGNSRDLAISQAIKRKQAEEELRLTQFSVEHASYAVHWVNPQGQIVYVNEAACRSLGRSREELLSLSVPDIDPLFLKISWEALWKELQVRGSLTFETHHHTKQGRVFPVEVTATYLEFGGKEYSFAFARDITERKQAEEVLRASESRYRLLFENNVAAIIRTTLDGRIIDCNRAAAHMLGFESPQEMLGLSMRDIHWDSENRVELMARLQAEKTVVGADVKFRHQDGRPLWFIVNLSLAPTENAGEPIVQGTLVDITERKQAEMALQISERRYRRFLERSAAGVIRNNMDGTIFDCNEAAARMLGFNSAAELKNHRMVELYFDRGDREIKLALLRKQKVLTGQEFQLKRRDGTRVWALGNMTLANDDGKEIIEATIVDITERKQAEAENARLVTAIEQAADGIVITDADARIQYVNPAFTNITGYTAAEALGQNPRVLKSGSHSADFYQKLWKTVLSGQVWHGEMTNRRKDGTTYSEAMTITPVRGADGAITNFIATKQDVTERKQAEEALCRERYLLRTLIDNLPDIIYVKDTEGRFLVANPGVARLMGVATGEDLLRKTDSDFYSKELAVKFRSDEEEIMRSGQPVINAEELAIDPGGRKRWILSSKVPFRNTRGDVVGLVGIGRDITERKQFEVELRHSQKLEAVGGLAAGIAHELNTPIQFVGDNTHFLQTAFTDLVKVIEKYQQLRDAAANAGTLPTLVEEVTQAEETVDLAYLMEEIPKAAEQSLDGVGRVATIVRAMKEFAHPDRSEKMATDLNRALESTLIVARNELKYVADVQTDFEELPLVFCHGGDMNQVFLNLLVNAAHAIKDAVKGNDTKGLIRVQTRRDGEDVVISISDTGGGIPESIRHKIFEPFFTTKEVGRGTGQGLAIARSIVVEKHGGVLTFETEAARGTTFHIRLPISPDPKPERPA